MSFAWTMLYLTTCHHYQKVDQICLTSLVLKCMMHLNAQLKIVDLSVLQEALNTNMAVSVTLKRQIELGLTVRLSRSPIETPTSKSQFQHISQPLPPLTLSSQRLSRLSPPSLPHPVTPTPEISLPISSPEASMNTSRTGTQTRSCASLLWTSILSPTLSLILS